MPVARSIRVVLALAVLLAWALPAAALQPDKALHHYVRSTWSIEEGLPQISALAIAQDWRGYLWVGTQSGLARFDGVRFETFTSDDTPALAGIWVRALHAGRDGRLWIGTYKGLAVHDGRTFQPLAAADPERWLTPSGRRCSCFLPASPCRLAAFSCWSLFVSACLAGFLNRVQPSQLLKSFDSGRTKQYQVAVWAAS